MPPAYSRASTCSFAQGIVKYSRQLQSADSVWYFPPRAGSAMLRFRPRVRPSWLLIERVQACAFESLLTLLKFASGPVAGGKGLPAGGSATGNGSAGP